MIKNKQIANTINQLMLKYSGELDSSILLIQQNCSEAEFKEYRRGVGKVMGICSLK